LIVRLDLDMLLLENVLIFFESQMLIC